MERAVGSLVMLGFPGTGPEDVWPGLFEQVRRGQIGGVILFGHNVRDLAQLSALNAELRGLNPELLIAVDQEGGRVQRLSPEKGFPGFLSAKRVAATMSEAEALEHYRGLARALRGAGFDLDLAPVADLDLGCPVIGGMERSYSKDPAEAARWARLMIRALAVEGVLACLKHFPGHGSARGDTHEGLVDITESWSEAELSPFYECLKPGGARLVMTGHLLHRGLDPDRPATLSPRILRELLREKGHADTVVISDDLHMGAILKNYGLEESVLGALEAGVDILLFSNNPSAAKQVPGFRPDPELPSKVAGIVRKALKDGRLSRERIEESRRRIAGLRTGGKSYA